MCTICRFCPHEYHPFDPQDTDKYVISGNYIPIWKVRRIYVGLHITLTNELLYCYHFWCIQIWIWTLSHLPHRPITAEWRNHSIRQMLLALMFRITNAQNICDTLNICWLILYILSVILWTQLVSKCIWMVIWMLCIWICIQMQPWHFLCISIWICTINIWMQQPKFYFMKWQPNAYQIQL